MKTLKLLPIFFLFAFQAFAQNTGIYPLATASGTDTYTATLSPVPSAYVNGQRFNIKFTNANTGAATINFNSLGAKSIVKEGGTALSASDIKAGEIKFLVYDGTNMQVVGGGGGATVTVSNGLTKVGDDIQLGSTTALTKSTKITVGDVSNPFSVGATTFGSGKVLFATGYSPVVGSFVGGFTVFPNHGGSAKQWFISGDSLWTNFSASSTRDHRFTLKQNLGVISIQGQGGVQWVNNIAGGFQGFQYLGDYSPNYTDRSLIDRGFANSNYWKTSGTTTISSGVSVESTNGDIALKGNSDLITNFGTASISGYEGATLRKRLSFGGDDAVFEDFGNGQGMRYNSPPSSPIGTTFIWKDYVDAKVEDNITNGATSTAPSENAVFDALALKVDKTTTIAGVDLQDNITAAELKTAIGVPAVAVLGSDVTNNNAVANTYEDITGLSFPVIANKQYRFKFVIQYTAAATSTGSNWSINGPTLLQAPYYAVWSNGGSAFMRVTSGYDNALVGSTTTASGTNTAIIDGLIECTASGTVIGRFSSEVAGSAITALTGSYVEYQQLD